MDAATQEFLLEALCHRQRLDLTGEITGAVAHDLNNALSVVNGNVELLLERLQEGEATQDPGLLQDARTVHNWSVTAMNAARRLLHFSRQLRAGPQVTVASDLAAEAAELCRYRCETEGLLLLTDFSPSAGSFEAPPGQILQILIAMIQNAREALGTADEGGSIQLSSVAADERVCFVVEDDGPGISAAIGDRVFDLGYTTKGGDHPAGLGLTIGRLLARRFGGDLTVQSTGDGGFQQLTLPRVSGTEALAD